MSLKRGVSNDVMNDRRCQIICYDVAFVVDQTRKIVFLDVQTILFVKKAMDISPSITLAVADSPILKDVVKIKIAPRSKISSLLPEVSG